VRRNLLILTSLCLFGCTRTDEPADPPPPATDQPDVRQIAATYHTLRPMTKEPVFVDPGLAMLCRGATQAEVEAARKVSGPHAHTAVTIFMNDLAANSFGKPNVTYPVGSIIVKEKKALGYWSTTQPREMTTANDGVGGMIKRPPGYDPAHGDWEYFYFEDPNKVESGKMNSCIQCHTGAARKDHVFGNWAAGGHYTPQRTDPAQRSPRFANRPAPVRPPESGRGTPLLRGEQQR
jgi:hypothetical protein